MSDEPTGSAPGNWGMSAPQFADFHAKLRAANGFPPDVAWWLDQQDDGLYLRWAHDCASLPASDWSVALLPLFGDRGWQLVSREPLTIAPSLLCGFPQCAKHGFIRDGRWLPA